MENVNNTVDTTSPFIWVQDGNGMKHKHINFDNSDICPRHGMIEIEALKKTDSERGLSNNASYAKFVDKKTGIIWGKPTGIHNISKEIQYQRLRLGNNTFFDRTDPMQAELCCIVLKAIESGKFVDTQGRPRFKVRDKEAAAQKEIDTRSHKKKAIEIIESLPYGEELKDCARNMGINPDVYSPMVLANELCNVVEGVNGKAPRAKEFLDMYNSPTKTYLTILKNAMSMAVIEFNPMEGFKYGGMNIGKTQELAIAHLVKNPDLAAAINTFTLDKRAKGLEQTSKPITSLPMVGGEDPEKEALKKRLAEMEALITQMGEKKLSTGDVEKNIAPKVDMEALRAEAKALGVKGWQVAKISPEALQAKIDAKKLEATEA
jgi:hypothetical protein